MIYVHIIMGPEIENMVRSESTMDASAGKDNGVVAKEDAHKHLKCVSNYEDFSFEMDTSMVEQNSNRHMSENGKVDVVDFRDSAANELIAGKCEEATESSSSFDSVSGVENEAVMDDPEVVSDFQDATSAIGFGGDFRMRKRKLTPHWRAFIQPLQWRCKWVELQVKKLKFEALKYDRELSECNQKRQFRVEKLSEEGCNIKSVPFSGESRVNKVLQRKRRRRIEDTTNVTAYMLQHNLFSYYGIKLSPVVQFCILVYILSVMTLARWHFAENKKVAAGGASLDNEWSYQAPVEKINHYDEFGMDNDLLWLESTDGNESVEQILRKIGTLQGQIGQLKARLDKVMSDNAGKFTFADKMSLLVPSNALSSSARDSASTPNNGDSMAVGSYIASQLMSQYNVGDVVLPESAVSSHGEVNHLADVIESTNHSHVGGASGTADDLLIYSNGVKEDKNNFVKVKSQPAGKPRMAKEQQGKRTIPPAHIESDLPTDDRPSPKVRSISKLTASKGRKRKGRRKFFSSKSRRS